MNMGGEGVSGVLLHFPLLWDSRHLKFYFTNTRYFYEEKSFQDTFHHLLGVYICWIEYNLLSVNSFAAPLNFFVRYRANWRLVFCCIECSWSYFSCCNSSFERLNIQRCEYIK
jgi:hypothetical protein